MNEWWLVILLFIVTIFACTVIIYPLRRSGAIKFLLVPLIFIMSFTGYYFWGGFAQWQEYLQRNDAQELAQSMLKSIKSPQELIDKLKTKLDAHPESAKGWYLLGRLYTSQNDIPNASLAFAKAHQIQPEDEQFAVHYAHSSWQLNNQQFNSDVLDIFHRLLKNNPNQPDALAMLAMHAFLSHDYEAAINYWERLLKLAPAQSDEAVAIRKAIAKAQEQLHLGGEQSGR
ncbi:cytochrome C biogenesis protein CcmH [Legionella norrlandica]|uniref:Cytochrome C biogenesis protein CcmH n=1 Tax=Legionella norrlandica TaxID=1498499 RepID=A0A0A2SR06_9GAMM|nr:tetratricopeptide repeat protein [Legionella norrlandica]KGP63187.1 cytochrome C biogenesis protein CcmH [Legionella norrlandica]